jgi:hypothetical protein
LESLVDVAHFQNFGGHREERINRGAHRGHGENISCVAVFV